jgi:hypothetical protein
MSMATPDNDENKRLSWRLISFDYQNRQSPPEVIASAF